MTAPSLQLKVRKMASASTFILVLLGLAASTKGSIETCGLFAVSGMDVTVPLEHKLESQDKLKWIKGSEIIFLKTGSTIQTGKSDDISPNGSLILKKVSKKDENVYEAEVYNSSGMKQGSIKKIKLCVRDAVKKPDLNAVCNNGKVTFTCIPDQKDQNEEIKWFENPTRLLKGNSKDLVLADVKNKKIYCQVSNGASSENSDSKEASCTGTSSGGTNNWLKDYIWYLVIGGGGVVLLLMVLVIACCIRNRRRRHMRMRDEMEFRLNHTNAEHHHPHQQHPPLPRERQQNQHRQQPAGNTGPRQNCSRHQRASEPGNGHPQPSPRRAAQAPKATNQNEEEVPPPLPQPRKKGPRPQQH